MTVHARILLISGMLLCIRCTLIVPVGAQDTLTLPDIWASGKFSVKNAGTFYFLKDGQHFTRLNQNAIYKYDLLSGDRKELVFEGGSNLFIENYSFSADEAFILLESKIQSIYRHSYSAEYWVFDSKKKKLFPVSLNGKQQMAAFSPDGRQVAFVRDNNIFIADYSLGRELKITNDGERNKIINGVPDWVYEEEFSFARAFEWSPDGTRLAFYKFDETQVPEYSMTLFQDNLYPKYETFKYPKVGAANSLVSIHIYDLANETISRLDTGSESDQYIPRIKWTTDPNQLCVFRMNRHQNNLDLILFDVQSGTSRILLNESNTHYISIHDHLKFLADHNHFIWTSEADGYNHIYLYDMQGKLVRQITKGDWDVTSCYGVDEAKGKVYFQAARLSPLRREVYETSLKNDNIRSVLAAVGENSAIFSPTFDYLIGSHSDINTPPMHAVYKRSGEYIRLIENNSPLSAAQRKYEVQKFELFSFTTSEGVQLNGWMIKPGGFKPDKKYPVLMFQYGGPGYQDVLDAWFGSKHGGNFWWFQKLAKEGFLIACVDGRGSGGRGESFKKMTYLQLGHFETLDQIEAAKFLGKLPYVDSKKIGIYGWSYGGYLSSLCLLKGNDVFKSAIAVAPIANWKWYDSIYTERYMRTVQENPDGYHDNSPVYFADRLKGDYLLIHGMADDNVHFQHTAEMANALIEANKHFDTYFYPNRNHGLGGGYGRLHVFTKITDFIRENLGE